jgi:hypothetical protein
VNQYLILLKGSIKCIVKFQMKLSLQKHHPKSPLPMLLMLNFLLLRERRSATLSLMQEVAIEVKSNILVADKLKSKGDRDRKKQKEELPSSSHTTSDSKMDEMDKMLKTLTSEMDRLKMEQKQPITQEGGYRNPN